MTVIDWLIGGLEPLNIVRLILFMALGILAGIMLRPRPGNRVLKMFPDDKRYAWFNVNMEHAFSLDTKKKKGYSNQRYLKVNPGYTGVEGSLFKKAQTIFPAIVGTAYIQRVNSDPINMNVAKYVQGIWGPEFYGQVPKVQREQLENEKVNVTVKFNQDFGPTGSDGKPLSAVSEEDLKTEADVQAAATFWKGKKVTESRKILDFIFVAGTGFAICAVCFLLGLLKVGS